MMAKLSAHGRTEVARFERVHTGKDGSTVTDTAAVMSDGWVLFKTKIRHTDGSSPWSSGWGRTKLRFSTGDILATACAFMTSRDYKRV